jgi:hypothetical protein
MSQCSAALAAAINSAARNHPLSSVASAFAAGLTPTANGDSISTSHPHWVTAVSPTESQATVVGTGKGVNRRSPDLRFQPQPYAASAFAVVAVDGAARLDYSLCAWKIPLPGVTRLMSVPVSKGRCETSRRGPDRITRRGRLSRPLVAVVAPSRYGSISMVQLYVPGLRPLAVTVTGSAKPCGELPMFALAESTHVIFDWVPPDT